ncbi:gamma-butyrobetaine dioxygenase-like isoform X1 [Scylla paramamosain]|uniref:gamma-butyrobetaine dioxygenase-like isoform X1 n=1 Tax=Scylla paramamosain TaxID=85552 RepID=UPI003082A203
MSSQRCFRAALATGGVLRSACRPALLTASMRPVICTTQKRGVSLAAAAYQQAAARQHEAPACSVASAVAKDDILTVKFGNGTEGQLPFVWLRDNCQCPQCFSVEALGRKLLMDDLDIDVHPTKVQQESDSGLTVEWSDGHMGEYPAQWLKERAFTPTARALHKMRYAVRKEAWGAEHTMKEYDYRTLMADDRELLDWLLTMERKGSAMVRNTPQKDIAGPELIEHIAYVKQSHYGPHSPVINRPNTNNVAFTNAKLGMHNDLPQYEHMPGIIFIQCVAQHPGAGGESIVTDGLFAAEELRRNHPEDFKILSSTDMYFWDKGHANYSWEMPEFYKIAKFPVIRINGDNEVVQIAVNNAIRDSHMDLPPTGGQEILRCLQALPQHPVRQRHDLQDGAGRHDDPGQRAVPARA